MLQEGLQFWEQRMDGFNEGSFPHGWLAGVFLARRSVIGREVLLELDTSLAIATSGWRTIAIARTPEPPTPSKLFTVPFEFPATVEPTL